jgi:hypothetical protein
VLTHVDGCVPCRRVLAFAGQFAATEESPPRRKDARTSFRIGIELARLRAAIEDVRPNDAAAALRALRDLCPSALFSERWSLLDHGPLKCLSREEFLVELQRLEGELAPGLEPPALALGRWAETSRQAAASRHHLYFAEPYFHDVLASLDGADPVRQVRRALAASSRLDLRRLETTFQRLIRDF